jgi:hypothetical protein
LEHGSSIPTGTFRIFSSDFTAVFHEKFTRKWLPFTKIWLLLVRKRPEFTMENPATFRTFLAKIHEHLTMIHRKWSEFTRKLSEFTRKKSGNLSAWILLPCYHVFLVFSWRNRPVLFDLRVGVSYFCYR